MIVNERIKSYLKDPALYETIVVIDGNRYSCHAYADGGDIQSAEDISLNYLCVTYDLKERRIESVATRSVPIP